MRARAAVTVFIVCVLVFGLGAVAFGQAPSIGRFGSLRRARPPSDSTAARCARFDRLPVGSELRKHQGITFTNTHGSLIVQAAYPGEPFSPPNSILPEPYENPGNRTRATPSALVLAARVTLGDYDGDEDFIYLEAFDSTGALVASDSDFLPAPLEGGIDLFVTSETSNIAYIEFWAEHEGGYNSVYFDNVCFRE
jgi:hypothetical protein